jgi:hypothetical protein
MISANPTDAEQVGDMPYILRLISSRCGPEAASAVVPLEIFEGLLQVIMGLEDRIRELEARTDSPAETLPAGLRRDSRR